MFASLGIFAAGVIVGGFLINVDLRCPAPLKSWLANWFTKKDNDAASVDKPAGKAKA